MKKRKRIIDAITHHFVQRLDQLRSYDKTQVIETDAYVINKILKLSIMDRKYFQLFDKILEEIAFIPDIQKAVKLSLFSRITKWFKGLDESEFLSKKQILVLFGLLLTPH